MTAPFCPIEVEEGLRLDDGEVDFLDFVSERTKRFAALARRIQSREIVRGDWRQVRDGRELGCLLLTLAPEVRGHRAVDDPEEFDCSSRHCPAWLMPGWMAFLTPTIDDYGTPERWSEHLQLYAGLGRRWHVLSGAAWDRVRWTLVSAVVDEIMKVQPAWLAEAPAPYGLVPELCQARARGEVVRTIVNGLPVPLVAGDLALRRAKCSGYDRRLEAWITPRRHAFLSVLYCAEELAEDLAYSIYADATLRRASELFVSKKNRGRYYDRMFDVLFDKLEQEIVKEETKNLTPAMREERAEPVGV